MRRLRFGGCYLDRFGCSGALIRAPFALPDVACQVLPVDETVHFVGGTQEQSGRSAICGCSFAELAAIATRRRTMPLRRERSLPAEPETPPHSGRV
jgi:hypothetical protein